MNLKFAVSLIFQYFRLFKAEYIAMTLIMFYAQNGKKMEEKNEKKMRKKYQNLYIERY